MYNTYKHIRRHYCTANQCDNDIYWISLHLQTQH